MSKYKIFISSVQKEFREERCALKDYIYGDALLSRYFEVFLFEDMPAADRRTDEVYIDEVKRSDIYLGLFGNQYGVEDNERISPTHKEFLLASQTGKPRFIFVKGDNDTARHPKMIALLRMAGDQLIRRRFNTTTELHSAVYASLVQYLLGSGRLLTGPFDTTVCRNAELGDISEDKIRWFLSRARNARDYALAETTPVVDVLTHLDLLDKGKPNHAAILLFGIKPQRFLVTSELKCMHFHGTRKLKPIPSYQIYKGTIFDLVDKSVDFVMSKLNRFVGTRKHGPEAPVEYDIPQEVVVEGIVNAVAHRDYTSNASVEVMLFSDRLEVWNPGTLPPSLTIKSLRRPHSSQPGNPLIAEPLFLTKYIEKAGTGTVDMYDNCHKAGMKPPKFRLENGFFILTIWRKKPSWKPESTTQLSTQSTDPVVRILSILQKVECSSGKLRSELKIKHRPTFRQNYLHPALKMDLIEYTIPDKLNSRLQKYRLTKKGVDYLKHHEKNGGR
ncbi:MAG: Fic family protein [Elusimicrobiota bacterium]